MAALVGAGLVVKLWPMIVAVVVVAVAARLTRRAVTHRAERVEAERRLLAGLVQRADQQRALLLAGDERGGTFGEFSLCRNMIRA